MNEWLVGWLVTFGSQFLKNYQEPPMFLERTGKEPDDSRRLQTSIFWGQFLRFLKKNLGQKNWEIFIFISNVNSINFWKNFQIFLY
jgi:hypothetical protein